MAEEIKDKIAQISEATELAIRRKTAEMLPDNPTATGMKAADIKAAFFKGLTDGELSILAELARVITEANTVSSNEKTARANADTDLGNRIDDEETARKREDSALSGRIDTEEAARKSADTGLGGRIDTEAETRANADKDIESKAVAIPEYDKNTGVLTFKTLDGTTVKSHDIPIEKIIDDVKLSDDGKKFVFSFHNSKDIEVEVSRLTNPAWKTAIDDSDIPPTSKAVKSYAVQKRDYKDSVTSLRGQVKVYGVEDAAGDVLISAAAGMVGGTLVLRGALDSTIIAGDPRIKNNAATKRYTDNYYENLNDRINILESYTSVRTIDRELSGTGACIQVRDALSYGILKEVGGNVKTIEIGLLYDISKSVGHSSNAISDEYKFGDHIVLPANASKWGIRIPITKLGDNDVVNVQFFAKGKSATGGKWESVLLYDNAISAQGDTIPLGTSASISKNIGYVLVYKNPKNAFDEADLPLHGFEMRVIPDDLSKLHDVTLYNTKTYSIPDSVLEKTGNQADVIINLFERRITYTDGSGETVEDISEDLCEIQLMPSAVIRFRDANNTVVSSHYVLNYIENIGG